MKLKTKILKIINLIKVLNKGELYYRFLFNVRKKSKYFERKINLNQKESKAAKIIFLMINQYLKLVQFNIIMLEKHVISKTILMRIQIALGINLI